MIKLELLVYSERVDGVQEMIDGELSVRVFELIRATEGGQQRQRYTLPSRQRLEVAITSFLQAFRKIYVGEQVMNTSKVRIWCDSA